MAEIGRASWLAAMLHRVMAAVQHLVMAETVQPEAEAAAVERALELIRPGPKTLRKNL
jgi:hypothetical protein